jgi:hypothetical protein
MDNGKRLQEIEAEIKAVREEIRKLELNDPTGSWNEFSVYMQPVWNKQARLDREKRMLITPKFERDIPDYGDAMTLVDFVAAVKDGWFIDYDGSGEYVKGGKMSGISIYPSDVQNGAVRDDFDTIIWFNR